MKFWLKLMLCIIVIISIILSFSRYIIVRQNFINSINSVAYQYMNQNNMQRYYLESNIINNVKNGEEINKETIVNLVESLYSYMESDNCIGIYIGDREKIFSNFDNIDNLNVDKLFSDESDKYCLKQIDGINYMIYSSYLSINKESMYIVNIYDISTIYEERNSQIKEIMYIDIIVLIISSIFISIFSILFTRPIKKLNNMSRKISDGKFNERVNLTSNDEIGELADNFNIMAEEIENRIKQKDDFVNGFTHEIKTPMTTIIGYSDLLRLKRNDEEVTIKSLNYIYSEAKRLEELSHKLMTLMSLSEDRIELKSNKIKKFVERIIEKTVFYDIQIKTNLEESTVKFDEILLEVVLKNLISNAYKAEPKDNQILVEGKKINNKYRISVIDTGRGIPKEHINRVTEDFYMVDKSRSRKNGGSGIGLSLCNKILILHNSKINIKSEENIGTEVYFELEVEDDAK